MLIYRSASTSRAEEIVVSMYVLTAELINQTKTPTGSLSAKVWHLHVLLDPASCPCGWQEVGDSKPDYEIACCG